MLRTLVFALAVGTLSSLSGSVGRAAENAGADPDKRPNIIFIFTDDHAAHAIGAYGSKINATPNLDRLAKEGMLFRNCFVTNSICAPSRAVVLTGKHSHASGSTSRRTPRCHAPL